MQRSTTTGSVESRGFLEQFSGSRYFHERPPIATEAEADRRLTNGELRLVISIPPGFGEDLLRGRQPEVGVTVDGANTFRAATVKAYVQGLVLSYAAERLRRAKTATAAGAAALPIDLRPRFAYNQAFLSVNAVTPGVLMLLLVMVPAMMTALAVREKEIGSIANLRASPAGVLEFLIGKQLSLCRHRPRRLRRDDGGRRAGLRRALPGLGPGDRARRATSSRRPASAC